MYTPRVSLHVAYMVQAPEGMSTALCRDLLALVVLSRLHLLANGQLSANLVIFEHRGRKYVFATDTGLEARRLVARSITPEVLSNLRSPPSSEADWSRMQLLAHAGILVCPSSGLPVFDPTNAPPCLWAFFTKLATALNAPSENASFAAAATAQQLAQQLRSSATRSGREPSATREAAAVSEAASEAATDLARQHPQYLMTLERCATCAGEQGEETEDDETPVSIARLAAER